MLAHLRLSLWRWRNKNLAIDRRSRNADGVVSAAPEGVEATATFTEGSVSGSQAAATTTAPHTRSTATA